MTARGIEVLTSHIAAMMIAKYVGTRALDVLIQVRGPCRLMVENPKQLPWEIHVRLTDA